MVHNIALAKLPSRSKVALGINIRDMWGTIQAGVPLPAAATRLELHLLIESSSAWLVPVESYPIALLLTCKQPFLLCHLVRLLDHLRVPSDMSITSSEHVRAEGALARIAAQDLDESSRACKPLGILSELICSNMAAHAAPGRQITRPKL